MSTLDAFAIVVLVLLALSFVTLLVVLGAMPGRVAASRHHPQAPAVAVAGWVGLLFLPLWPLALIWAFVDLPEGDQHRKRTDDGRGLRTASAAAESSRAPTFLREAAE